MKENKSEKKRPVVPLGRLLVEADVPAQLRAAGVTVDELVRRHQAGDWGMVDEFEQEHLDWSAAHGKPVTSTFVIWIEGKARTVFITTEEKMTYVVLI